MSRTAVITSVIALVMMVFSLSAEAKEGDGYAGLKGNLIPYATYGADSGKAHDAGFSGGVTAFAEYAVRNWFQIGGEIGYLILMPDYGWATVADDSIGLINVDPTFRFTYAIDNFEAYFRLGVGFSYALASKTQKDLGYTDGFGWNVSLSPGIMYKQEHVGVFFEPSFLYSGTAWEVNGASLDQRIKGVLLNVGVCGIF